MKTFLLIYLIVAFLLAIPAVKRQKEILKKQAIWKQLLFFSLLPILYIRELLRK